jgi:hypothetical protein
LACRFCRDHGRPNRRHDVRTCPYAPTCGSCNRRGHRRNSPDCPNRYMVVRPVHVPRPTAYLSRPVAPPPPPPPIPPVSLPIPTFKTERTFEEEISTLTSNPIWAAASLADKASRQHVAGLATVTAHPARPTVLIWEDDGIPDPYTGRYLQSDAIDCMSASWRKTVLRDADVRYTARYQPINKSVDWRPIEMSAASIFSARGISDGTRARDVGSLLARIQGYAGRNRRPLNGSSEAIAAVLIGNARDIAIADSEVRPVTFDEELRWDTKTLFPLGYPWNSPKLLREFEGRFSTTVIGRAKTGKSTILERVLGVRPPTPPGAESTNPAPWLIRHGTQSNSAQLVDDGRFSYWLTTTPNVPLRSLIIEMPGTDSPSRNGRNSLEEVLSISSRILLVLAGPQGFSNADEAIVPMWASTNAQLAVIRAQCDQVLGGGQDTNRAWKVLRESPPTIQSHIDALVSSNEHAPMRPNIPLPIWLLGNHSGNPDADAAFEHNWITVMKWFKEKNT